MTTLGGTALWLGGGQPALAAGASTLYVAANGNDGSDCTSAGAPCATVSYALSQAGAAGDVVYVAGTIDDHVTVTSAQGSGSSPLTIEGWPGQVPAVLDGTSNGTILTVGSGASVTVSRLTFQHGHAADGAPGTNGVTSGGAGGPGGAGAAGGAISNNGTVRIADSTF
ncbi:MAG: hypothetical protein ACRDTP_08505, partial [Mycobacteriales bacterium]